MVQITPQNPLPATTADAEGVVGSRTWRGMWCRHSTTHLHDRGGSSYDRHTVCGERVIHRWNATGVPLNVALSLQTNAAIDLTTTRSAPARSGCTTIRRVSIRPEWHVRV